MELLIVIEEVNAAVEIGMRKWSDGKPIVVGIWSNEELQHVSIAAETRIVDVLKPGSGHDPAVCISGLEYRAKALSAVSAKVDRHLEGYGFTIGRDGQAYQGRGE
jgi:hypothetical protein